MPNSVYIYDAVRTPRSKGKSTGTLHEVKPIDLAAGLLVELQKRHDLDTVGANRSGTGVWRARSLCRHSDGSACLMRSRAQV